MTIAVVDFGRDLLWTQVMPQQSAGSAICRGKLKIACEHLTVETFYGGRCVGAIWQSSPFTVE